MPRLRDDFEADPLLAAEREARLHPDDGEAARRWYRIWLRGEPADTHARLTERLLEAGLSGSFWSRPRADPIPVPGPVVTALIEALIVRLVRPWLECDSVFLPNTARDPELGERIKARVRGDRSTWRPRRGIPDLMVSEAEAWSARDGATTPLVALLGELALEDGVALAALRRLDEAELPGHRLQVALGTARLNVDPDYLSLGADEITLEPTLTDDRARRRANRRRRLNRNRGPRW